MVVARQLGVGRVAGAGSLPIGSFDGVDIDVGLGEIGRVLQQSFALAIRGECQAEVDRAGGLVASTTAWVGSTLELQPDKVPSCGCEHEDAESRSCRGFGERRTRPRGCKRYRSALRARSSWKWAERRQPASRSLICEVEVLYRVLVLDALVGHPPRAAWQVAASPHGLDQVRVLELRAGVNWVLLGGHEVGLHDGRRHQAAIFDRFQARAEFGLSARGRLFAPARRRRGAFRVSQPGREQRDASPFESWSAIQ